MDVDAHARLAEHAPEVAHERLVVHEGRARAVVDQHHRLHRDRGRARRLEQARVEAAHVRPARGGALGEDRDALAAREAPRHLLGRPRGGIAPAALDATVPRV
ncbi:MAG: hypothetical protein U5K43_08800, partial [Halofilum sp. (in: g-proteobacteria)]|nr:hypothetical protein [Halofilum sp. (in: g-proteobacteria)]